MVLTVFVSSRSDLKDERRVVTAAVEEDLGLRAETFEEWPALSKAPEAASIAAVREADMLVLLLGPSYGMLASTGRSIVYEEYLAAREKKIPVLAFQVSDAEPEPPQLEFIAVVKGDQTVRPVQSLEDLRTAVRKAITGELVRQRGIASPEMPAPAVEVGRPSDARSLITIGLQADEIEQLRDTLSRHAAEQLNQARAGFRSGRTDDAIASLEKIRSEPEWTRVDTSMRSRILTALATFKHSAGATEAEVEGILKDAKSIDPQGDFSYIDALLTYEQDGAAAAIERLEGVRTTNAFNLKVALLLELDRRQDATALLAAPPPESIQPDAETVRLRAFVALADGDANAAIRILDDALKAEPESESLRVAASIARVASAVTPSERPRQPHPWLAPIDPAFVIATEEALSRLDEAAATLDDVIRTSQRKGVPLRQMHAWRLAAVALHPSRRKEAHSVASALLEADPADPTALVWSVAYGFDIDIDHAVAALVSSDEPITPTRVVGVVDAIAASGDLSRAEALLAEQQPFFEEEQDLWRFWRARLLAGESRFEEAATLAKEIDRADLRDTAELLIAAARGHESNDPDEYLALVDRVEPGYNALVARARLGRWSEIVEKAVELVESGPSAAAIRLAATALFRVREHERSLQLLREHSPLWSSSPLATDLRRLTIDNQIVLGEFAKALQGAQELFHATKSGRDLLMTIRVAIAAGHQKDARFWASQLLDLEAGQVAVKDLLDVSRMVAIEDRELARRLWLRADEIGLPEDLVALAMGRAFALGLDEEGNRLFTMLRNKPSAASAFRAVSVEELLAMQQEAGEAFGRIYRAYAAGDFPLAMLIADTRQSLAEVYDAQLAEARTAAVGSMAPLYVRHGGRMLGAHLSLEETRTLTLDVSTLLLAEYLGVLDAVEKRFDSLRISPATCTALAEQQDRLRSPQPRVDQANAMVVRLVEEGRITQIPATTPSGVVAELEPRLGAEWAATMQEAIVNDGYVVSEVPLLDQSAVQIELPAELQDRIRTPAQFAESVKDAPVPPGARLYLTGSTAVTLAYEKRLESLATELTVFADQSALANAQAHSKRRASRDALGQRLANLSQRLGTGLSSGKYRTFPVTKSDDTREPADLTTHALVDLLRASGEPEHAFVIDDRFVSSQLELAGSPVVTLPNVLTELRRSEHLRDEDYFLILLQLRRANYRYIDLDGDEIVHWLTKAKIIGGVVEESEPLQILRVYLNDALSDRNLRIAPLFMTNSQRAFGEGAFAMNSEMAVNRALSEIWSLPNVTPEDRMAYSDWLLRSLYTGSYGVHHLYGGFNKPRMLMAMDLSGLLTTVMAVFKDNGFDQDRGEAFISWIEGRVVDYRLDADPDLLSDVVAQINHVLTDTVRHHGGRGRKVIHEIYSLLPDRIRVPGANDQAFAKAVDLQTRPSIRIADFEFGANEFWLGIEELRTKSEVVIRANSGMDVQVTIAPPEVGKGLLFDDGNGQRLFPHETFVSLGFDPPEEQRQHLREHPEIFDTSDDRLNEAIEAVLELPRLQNRLHRIEEIAQRSAASHYDRLRRTLGHAVIEVNELLPGTDSLLRHYLPGYVDGTTLDPASAFAPLLERSELLDVLRRAVVLPIALPDALRERFSAEPEEKRHAMLTTLAAEAASPIARAQIAILGYASASDADRQLASRLIDELLDRRMAPQVELFKRVLLWVYWRLSFDDQLAPDVRLLLTWAHAARLTGLLMTTDIDVSEFNYLFLAQGQTFSDDMWTRSETTHDVLHPLVSNEVRMVCAAVAHTASSVPLEADRLDIARRLQQAMFPSGPSYPVSLMRDLTLATNVTGSLLMTNVADAFRPVDESAAALLSHEAKMEALRTATADIDCGENPVLAWRTIGAIIGHLPPPTDVREWFETFVMSPAIETLVTANAAIEAFSVLAELHTHFNDDVRQRVEEAAIAAATHWQQETALRGSAVPQDAARWTMVAASLAARPGSREQTGAALGRTLQRFIDAAPAVAPSAFAMLTMLPMRLPMAYLPALWPAVIAARAAPSALSLA